jgi:hypothetical protein
VVKKFQEGTCRPSSRSSEAFLPNLVQISFVLLNIEVFFFLVARPTHFLFFLPHRPQGEVAEVTNSKDEVSWIVLCNVRYKGHRMA